MLVRMMFQHLPVICALQFIIRARQLNSYEAAAFKRPFENLHNAFESISKDFREASYSFPGRPPGARRLLQLVALGSPWGYEKQTKKHRIQGVSFNKESRGCQKNPEGSSGNGF